MPHGRAYGYNTVWESRIKARASYLWMTYIPLCLRTVW